MKEESGLLPPLYSYLEDHFSGEQGGGKESLYTP